jgi:alpha/beta superfamily hydrolase
MNSIKNLIANPSIGEQAFVFQNGHNNFEAIMLHPESARNIIGIIGHPHSLQGGSMQNKVVTTTARAMKDLHIPSIRFNFRGVGNSDGVFDNGLGESEDFVALCRQILAVKPDMQFIFAGFSFGSFVSFRAACEIENLLLISIAPPVPRFDFHFKKPLSHEWHIIQGDADEVVEPNTVIDLAKTKNIPIHIFTNTGHFFHGKLLDLRNVIQEIINDNIKDA